MRLENQVLLLLSLTRIQSRQKFSDGGDLEEPVETRFLSCVIHIFQDERV